MPDYNEKSPSETTTALTPFNKSPPPFDFERLTRFMAYGFLMSPLQFHWFAFLTQSFPLTKQSATLPALQRVCCDQLMFAPFGSFISGPRVIHVLTNAYRTGMLLYLHDCYGRWRKAGCDTQTPGCISTFVKGQLHALASCANAQLQGYSPTIPNRKSLFKMRYSANSILTSFAAFRVNSWYCLDGLLVIDQFFR